jgi:hypothetical protein
MHQDMLQTSELSESWSEVVPAAPCGQDACAPMCCPIARDHFEPLKEQSGEISEQVWKDILKLLTEAYPREGLLERRRDARYPFPFPVYLTPVGEDGLTPSGESVVAAGKDLSESGLGFYHAVPLPYRRFIVSVEKKDRHWLRFLLDLIRSRSIRPGWHESSGRFVESTLPPMESD